MKLLKTIPVILFLLGTFSACEKEYFPDMNAYRDTALIGTWVEKHNEMDSSIMVFTEDGYYGNVYWIDNNNYTGFGGLTSIWHISKRIDSTGIGEFYTRSTNSNFTHRGWESTLDYYYSLNKDTLYISGNVVSPTGFSFFTKSKYQLIYEGQKYVGIDSISVD